MKKFALMLLALLLCASAMAESAAQIDAFLTLPEGFAPIAEAEEQIIREAYGRYGGNMTEMARRLGIGRTTLWRKCKALGIQGT